MACHACDGTGVLLDQTYGTWPTSPGDPIRSVQRCDTCSRHDDDITAATHAARNLNQASSPGDPWYTTIGWIDPIDGPTWRGIGATGDDESVAAGTDVVIITNTRTALETWKAEAAAEFVACTPTEAGI
jgi:hypothetical protein